MNFQKMMKSFVKLSLLLFVSIGQISGNNPGRDVSYKELVRCNAGSVINQLELGYPRFYLEIPCDRPWSGRVPVLYNATIDGQVIPLEIAELNLELAVEDGKLSLSCSGQITGPERCAGDRYQDRFIFKPSTPLDCSGSNNFPDSIRVELSRTSITGQCSSQCSAIEAGYQVVGSGN